MQGAKSPLSQIEPAILEDSRAPEKMPAVLRVFPFIGPIATVQPAPRIRSCAAAKTAAAASSPVAA
jgi:hypothetical protein